MLYNSGTKKRAPIKRSFNLQSLDASLPAERDIPDSRLSLSAQI